MAVCRPLGCTSLLLVSHIVGKEESDVSYIYVKMKKKKNQIPNFNSFSFTAPLVDSSVSGHNSTAVILLVSGLVMGLAVFIIYTLKRYTVSETVNFGVTAAGERFSRTCERMCAEISTKT